MRLRRYENYDARVPPPNSALCTNTIQTLFAYRKEGVKSANSGRVVFLALTSFCVCGLQFVLSKRKRRVTRRIRRCVPQCCICQNRTLSLGQMCKMHANTCCNTRRRRDKEERREKRGRVNKLRRRSRKRGEGARLSQKGRRRALLRRSYRVKTGTGRGARIRGSSLEKIVVGKVRAG